ncbi:PfkB family carbohydrate kinase [Cellulomonas sp. JZ18]|uniref:PfkB family carbohydrate kinase n=1 Tax=Cellulomonas sp. JZ18 TaxID=2654191 RepID=UPI001E47BF92|nr:PfkB family carbohydrate kinase [Cellulomonas sp. JZ18]
MATTPWLTVTIEASTTHAQDASEAPPEVHVHPGGQGLWVARMAESLGADAVVCGPFGGEAGIALRALAEAEGIELRAVAYGGGNGVYVHDRREGERATVAERPAAPLDRHELDDLYGTVLVEGLEAEVTVLTGADPAHVLPRRCSPAWCATCARPAAPSSRTCRATPPARTRRPAAAC